MPSTQRLLFTAVPRPPSPDGRPPRVSVFVSPRLYPEGRSGTLAQFPDLANWPETVRGITWTVLLDGQSVPATVDTAPETAPWPALWQALLPADTPVRSHTPPDYADREVRSYSTSTVLDQVRRIWQAVLADSPTRVPADERLLRGIVAAAHGSLGPADDPSSFDAVLAALAAAPIAPRRTPQDTPPGDLDELPVLPLGLGGGRLREVLRQRYTHEQQWLDGQAAAAAEYRQYVEDLEQLRRRAEKLRQDADPAAWLNQAGLRGLYDVRDFHTPPPRTDPHEPEPPHRRPTAPEPDLHQRLALLGGHPLVLRRLGLIVDLTLDPAAPALQQPVHGSLECRARWTARLPDAGPDITAVTLLDPTPSAFRAAAGPAGLVEAGLLRLTAPDGSPRATPVVADPDGAALGTLAATEGLLRRTLWRDSPDRQGADGLPTLRSAGLSLALDGRGALLKESFGRSRALDTGLTDGAPDAAALTAEDLTRGYRVDVRDVTTGTKTPWYSLTARRRTYRVNGLPDFDLVEEGFVQPTATSPGDAGSRPGSALSIGEGLFLWQGWSLSVARPGTPVNGRDQVGHGGSDGEAEAGPLGLHHTDRVVPGSLPPLRFGRSYRFRLRAVDLTGAGPALDDPGLSALLDGAAVSPEVRYTRFDPVPPPELIARAPQGPGDGPARLVLRSDYERLPAPETTERHIVPPRAAQLLAEQHGMLDRDGRPDPAAYATVLAPLEGGSYAALADPPAQPDPAANGAFFIDADTLPTAYLPDPLARGAALRGLPASPGSVHVAFAPGVEADGGPGEAARWPYLRSFRLQLREGPRGSRWYDHERMLVVWLPKADRCEVELSCSLRRPDLDLLGVWEWARDAGLATAALTRAALRGDVWTLTPPRAVQLVHAVRRPLVRPRFRRLGAPREAGSSCATVTGVLHFSRKSTGRVDLIARWVEQTDLGQGNTEAAQGVPEEVPPPGAEPRETTFALPLGPSTAHPSRLEVAQRQDFGDTKHRRITYTTVATTAFRECYADDDPGPFERRSAQQVVEVLASARPTPPKVLRLVPTYGWATGTDAGGRAATSTRHGYGLRVYLDRPWWSSGEDELLGVLLASDLLAPDARFLPFVTQWGNDPLQRGTNLRTDRPRPEHFRSAERIGEYVRLEELPRQRLTVAGHRVAFDQDSRLWYCDVLLDPNLGEEQPYQPFVRLALARWQPYALEGMALSRAVVTDFAQLAPDRFATLLRDAPDTVTVTLSGPHPREPRQLVRARLEQRLPAVPDPDLGWEPVGASITLTRDPVTHTWTGALPTPADLPPGTARVVLEEAELYPLDRHSQQDVTGERLVHLDILPL
ncbi:hypothetical protein WN990_16120 [Kitasatospora purpeofusca]|uniref:hypothetical protein n=1 Tax=Kitasatospora purpeofusca TaxID=67352 RepID=UPI0030F03A4B